MLICCRYLPILVLSGLLTALPSPQAAGAGTANVPPLPAKPPSTYPQIVRLSYVEGDVRIARGKQASKADAKESGEATGWEQAAANLALESGFSLVTGKGRAEIEFEDASTVYLADNSVLTFDDLSATGGVPRTEMALLSGAATVDVKTMAQGEWFILKTPTDDVSLKYPQTAFLRVNSYLDAMAVTPQRDLNFSVPGLSAARAMKVGQTITVHNGRRIYAAMPDAAVSSEWDRWVETRVAARDAAMAAAMKESGLTAPVPGLADMNGQGRFFPCEPYGTCWEPAQGWDGHAAEVAQVEQKPGGVAPVAAASRQTVQASAPEDDISQQVELIDKSQLAGSPRAAGQTAAQVYQAAHPGATLRTEDDFFPCSPEMVRSLIARDPVTGKEKIIGSEAAWYGSPYPVGFSRLGGYPRLWGYPYLNGNPWDWAVCHTGSWIHREHRYVWVAGLKRHHHQPVCWVKNGRSVGYVPIHPRDEKGKPPINLKYGIFTAKGEKGVSPERIAADAGKPVKVLDEAPKEFRKAYMAPLERAEVPHAEAHEATNMLLAAHGFTMKEQGMPITFDRKSQSFMVATRVAQEGRPATVAEPLGGRGGNWQARAGEGSSMARGTNYSGGENRGGSNAGAAAHGSSGGGSYSGGGGASHAGGGGGGFSGGGGGGGAAHSGGGGGASGGGASGGGGGGAHK